MEPLQLIGGGADTAHVKVRGRALQGVDLCDACKQREGFKLCIPMEQNVGTSCQKRRVFIAGVDFASVLHRLSALERYVTQQELLRANVTPEISALITAYASR